MSDIQFRSGSSSPNFLRQRKIAYVDNPFDEQASSCVQKLDVKYMNYPRLEQCHDDGDVKDCPSFVGVPVSGKKKDAEGEEKEVWALAYRNENFNSSDWSCLFSPVQCHDNSPTGEIQLSLCYDPRLGTLKVAVIKARGLTCPTCASKPRNSGIICVGTFISVSLFSNNKKVQTKKTEMKTRKAEIFFYDKFSFLVHKDDIGQCKLQCRAVHKVGSIIKRDHVIGQVLIGGEDVCHGDGFKHWREMLRRPKKYIAQWQYLKED